MYVYRIVIVYNQVYKTHTSYIIIIIAISVVVTIIPLLY